MLYNLKDLKKKKGAWCMLITTNEGQQPTTTELQSPDWHVRWPLPHFHGFS